jgi:proteic killer suppression protein
VVIRSYGDAATRQLFEAGSHRRFRSIARVALRKLQQLNAAQSLEEMASPPGNRLEALKGDRKGRHSIRINDQWRICFRWHAGDAYEVEIADYH